jgi:hypothetical protein
MQNLIVPNFKKKYHNTSSYAKVMTVLPKHVRVTVLEGKIQYPVYFIHEVLSDSKTWYFHIMKLAYALLIMSRKLSHYF